MGKKISLSNKELSTILQHYSLGKLNQRKYFSKGQAHTNIFLNTSKGKYVLKILSDRTEKVVQTDCEIVGFLRKEGFPTIEIVPTVYNKLFLPIKDKYCFIYKYVVGEQVNIPTTRQLDSVSKTLAQLHKISLRYFKKFPASRVSKNFCLDTAKNSAKKLNSSLAKTRLAWVKNELAKLDFPTNLTKSLLHRDFSQENILFKENRIFAVLDMDALGRGACVHDVASLIYFWAWFKESKRKLNMSLAKKLVTLYEKERPLSLIEKKRLYDALVLRCLIYVSWELAETNYDKEIQTNYYEFFKSLVEQVTSLGRDAFYQKLFY